VSVDIRIPADFEPNARTARAVHRDLGADPDRDDVIGAVACRADRLALRRDASWISMFCILTDTRINGWPNHIGPVGLSSRRIRE